MADRVSELLTVQCLCLSTLSVFLENNNKALNIPESLDGYVINQFNPVDDPGMWSMVKVFSGIYLTSSLRLTDGQPNQTVSTHNTAPPLVSMETPADSRAQTDSRLPRPATRLHAHAMRLRSTAMVSAWLQDHAPQARQFNL